MEFCEFMNLSLFVHETRVEHFPKVRLNCFFLKEFFRSQVQFHYAQNHSYFLMVGVFNAKLFLSFC